MSKPLNQTRLFNTLRELLECVVRVTDNFPRSHRYVVGAEMQRLAISMNRAFACAYLTRDVGSVACMDGLLADLSTLQLLVSLGVERRWITGRTQAAHLVRLLDGVAKQGTALRNAFAATYAAGDQSHPAADHGPAVKRFS